MNVWELIAALEKVDNKNVEVEFALDIGQAEEATLRDTYRLTTITPSSDSPYLILTCEE